MFPSIKNPTVESRPTGLKNVGRQVYICVRTDEQGNYVLRTTTRKLESTSRSELDFWLYYYTGADPTETKVVLPVHSYTNTCLRVTADKQLQIVPLHDETLQTNNLNSSENPRTFMKADERFFYFKASGSNVAFEAMHNGTSRTKYFLSLSPTNEPVVQEYNGDVYPDEMLFTLDNLDNGKLTIN